MKQYPIFILLAATIFTSCVSSKKFKASEANYVQLETRYNTLTKSLSDCGNQKDSLSRKITGLESDKNLLNSKINDLNSQIDILKQNNNQTLKQLESMSVITGQQAESIKKSMENIGAKDNYIQTLQQQMAHKDSLNMALVMNLKGAIGNIDDKDINIKVDKGVVYIDISDKLLFKSGSFDVTENAKTVLGKVAMVLKNQPNIEFMVEGHTDSVAYKGRTAALVDNWDLSVKRATSVVRILQKQYGLDPSKMAASGRSAYKPVDDNATKEGRAANRRTRIVILPQLDQFFKLLEPAKK
jgi:chemotaxis protein MotB